MDCNRSRTAKILGNCTLGNRILIGLLVLAGCFAAGDLQAQVRTKRPDRGVYRAPILESVVVEPIKVLDQDRPADVDERSLVEPVSADELDSPLTRVSHDEVVLFSPQSTLVESADGETIYHEPYEVIDQGHGLGHGMGSNSWVDGGCDGMGSCDGGCDGGCDSMAGACRNWSKTAIPLCRDQWFGGFDVMLMFRNGDRLPPLVTTGPATAATATVGQLGEPGTQILAGGGNEYNDVTAGFRLTLGAWLDESQSRSLVFRGWTATEADFGFNANDSDFAILRRPFFNSDPLVNDQATIEVATPGAASGSIHVNGSSEVFGGDISVRQLWHSQFGGRVDLLYGYQYMRLNEGLVVANESLALPGAASAPPGSVISISDSFDAENEFHGGQLGLAGNYREGRWSFRSLFKVGFGSLNRRVTRRGSTTTTNGPSRFVDPNGLLVRSTNEGTVNDATFGWVPELDLSIGWHQFPHFDVTMGYHIIAMTDAVQVSGAMDPGLASNLSDPFSGPGNPSPDLRFDTFYVQGIHFGLQYAY